MTLSQPGLIYGISKLEDSDEYIGATGRIKSTKLIDDKFTHPQPAYPLLKKICETNGINGIQTLVNNYCTHWYSI